MPGDSGVTVVTMLVCLFYFACEAAGASSARYSLRPLIFEGRTFWQNSRGLSGEIAKPCLDVIARSNLSAVAQRATASAEARRAKAEGGSDEAIQFSISQYNGLLRGACHRARIRATRWLAMTAPRLNCLCCLKFESETISIENPPGSSRRPFRRSSRSGYWY